MTIEIKLLGDKEFLAKLQRMDRKVAGPIVRSGVLKGLRVIAKQIKANVPPALKELKKTIGYKFSKRKGGLSKGITQARVGAGVGKKQPKLPKRNRPGVGLGTRNVHWAILGTGQRFKKKTGKSTGTMVPLVPDLVRKGFAQSSSAALHVMLESIRAKMVNEWERRSGGR